VTICKGLHDTAGTWPCNLLFTLFNAEYRDASLSSRVRQSSDQSPSSTTPSTTLAATNHWAAVQYVSGKGNNTSTRCMQTVL